MSSCEWEVQKAIYSRLVANITLMGMIEGIYDHVPDGSNFPYVVLQEIYAVDSSNLVDKITQIRMIVGVYTRERGSKTALLIMAEIKELLHHADIDVEAYDMLSFCLEASELHQMKDGLTYVGKMEFKGYVQED